MRTTLQRLEEIERIALLLPTRAEDAGDHLLRVCAARRSVPAAHFAGHDGGPNHLLGLPVGRFNIRVSQAGEECRPLGLQVPEEAAVRRMDDAAGEQAVGARLRHARRSSPRRRMWSTKRRRATARSTSA
jgi:hypothetical protein